MAFFRFFIFSSDSLTWFLFCFWMIEKHVCLGALFLACLTVFQISSKNTYAFFLDFHFVFFWLLLSTAFFYPSQPKPFPAFQSFLFFPDIFRPSCLDLYLFGFQTKSWYWFQRHICIGNSKSYWYINIIYQKVHFSIYLNCCFWCSRGIFG